MNQVLNRIRTGLHRLLPTPTIALLTLCATLGIVARSAEPTAVAPGAWKYLFDGKSLAGWKVTDFGGHGEAEIREGELHVGMGAMLTGLNYTNPTPRINFEVALEAKKTSGSDFFCGLTVPVNDTNCTLIVGGWGGGIVGISSLDSYDASENETSLVRGFAADRWYDIRIRVTTKKIQVWLDQDRVIDVSIEGRRVGMRAGEIELSAPFGLAAWQTGAAWRNIRIRTVSGPET